MTPIRIFISSVQQEFAREREHLRDYLRAEPLMRRFFEVFLFEDIPASDRRPDEVYLDEVERCEIYVGLLGTDYGFEDAHGVSPTEREFDWATQMEKHRLIFLKSAEETERHPKMRALIGRAQAGLVLRVAHQSLPANPLIAESMYLLRYIEKMGTRTVGMIRPDAVPTRNRILAHLRSDPTLTRAALASLVGVTPEGVKYHLDKLRKAGRIRHVGPTKTGRWEILESESTKP